MYKQRDVVRESNQEASIPPESKWFRGEFLVFAHVKFVLVPPDRNLRLLRKNSNSVEPLPMRPQEGGGGEERLIPNIFPLLLWVVEFQDTPRLDFRPGDQHVCPVCLLFSTISTKRFNALHTS